MLAYSCGSISNFDICAHNLSIRANINRILTNAEMGFVIKCEGSL